MVDGFTPTIPAADPMNAAAVYGPVLPANYSSSFNPYQQPPFLPLAAEAMQVQVDPHSPELFKRNITLVRRHVLNLQNEATNALAGIQNAYHPGSSPAQTESNISALKRTLEVLSDVMRHTGVGALPLLPFPQQSAVPQVAPTEQEMMIDVSKSVQVLYERLKRSQESAAVVANLLGTSDAPGPLRAGRK
ncbi:uncharacterized protein EV420DRAFT_1338840 [Desarmillaria tabescens]|uniref:Uncharacterized protein n=1 Tax=Armillaria tabescens TaxID=1929756 RepID=A0AA39MW64_ARMTA|nr:uncharacterized protein EV420DRAFT_1338840 [Desarmillaria tabescens]KAK0448458.1 hypothetical protein EV420DRAFT_1338840 [Desarmillaria tabescens]